MAFCFMSWRDVDTELQEVCFSDKENTFQQKHVKACGNADSMCVGYC